MKVRSKVPDPPTQAKNPSPAPPAGQPAVRPSARGTGIRRTQRVFLKVPVTVYGWSADGLVFNEESTTIVVNAHGALLAIQNRVREGQDLFLRNENTGSEVRCVVIHATNPENGRVETGVAFREEVPGFWGVYFPPDAGSGTARPAM